MKAIILLLLLTLSPVSGYHILEKYRINYFIVLEAQKMLPTCTQLYQQTPFTLKGRHYIGRCQIHGPNQYNPKPHVGVSVYIRDSE